MQRMSRSDDPVVSGAYKIWSTGPDKIMDSEVDYIARINEGVAKFKMIG